MGENIKLAEEISREYQLQIIEDNNFTLGKSKNLIPNLSYKRKYKLHYQNFI